MKKEKVAKTDKKKITLSKKQKEVLFGVTSFGVSFIVTLFIILTFAVFIPQGKNNEQKKKYNIYVREKVIDENANIHESDEVEIKINGTAVWPVELMEMHQCLLPVTLWEVRCRYMPGVS